MKNKKLEKRANITKITDKLYLSGSILDYNLLNELKIEAVINFRLEQHDDIYELTFRGISYFWIPISDYGAPRMDQMEACNRVVDKFNKVLLHCAVGRGRSATLVAAYLLYNKDFDNVDDCIYFITKKRKSVSLTENQYKKLCAYYKKMKI